MESIGTLLFIFFLAGLIVWAARNRTPSNGHAKARVRLSDPPGPEERIKAEKNGKADKVGEVKGGWTHQLWLAFIGKETLTADRVFTLLIPFAVLEIALWLSGWLPGMYHGRGLLHIPMYLLFLFAARIVFSENTFKHIARYMVFFAFGIYGLSHVIPGPLRCASTDAQCLNEREEKREAAQLKQRKEEQRRWEQARVAQAPAAASVAKREPLVEAGCDERVKTIHLTSQPQRVPRECQMGWGIREGAILLIGADGSRQGVKPGEEALYGNFTVDALQASGASAKVDVVFCQSGTRWVGGRCT